MLKYRLKRILSLVIVVLIAAVTSCDDDNEGGTSEVQLKSFGPSVLRGGELTFIGTNLKKVNTIILPENVEISASSFKTHTASTIVIDVPDEAVEGKVILKTTSGNIISKTPLSILEPITIASIPTAAVRPGDVITIGGTYLNLIEEVVFAEGKSVTEFESQSRTSLQIKVPMDAQTGLLILLDGAETPNQFKSQTELAVKMSVITSLSPSTIKAGGDITISGTDLDLATEVLFGGGKKVTKANFKSQTAESIVVTVPSDAQKGKVELVQPSTQKVQSPADLLLVISTITNITPAPAKTGGTITVTGTDLDLVSQVDFGGGKTGTIQTAGRTVTQFTVTVPSDAKTGDIVFKTKNNESVNKGVLTMLKPVIANFTAASVNTADNPSITITGTNLDIVKSIVFTGGFTGTVNGATSTQIVIPVVPGSLTGTFKLIANNGDEVTSAAPLTIVPNVPNVTTVPTQAFMGNYLTIEGSNMDVPAQIIFPGNIVATNFGSKTSTKIVVLVPETAPVGQGRLKFITSKNEIYESPMIAFKFPGTEPVVDPALVINGFDEAGHDLGWDNWGGNVELGTNATTGISGKYLHGTNAAAVGWTWIWGCNHGELPKKSIAKATHVFKMDVKITKPIPSGANFQMEFAGSRIDLGNLGGSTPGGGWITITYDLSTFSGLPDVITATGEWGINLGAGTVDLTGLYIDNIRFQAK